MWNLLKKIFITEVPITSEDVVDLKTKNLIWDIETLVTKDGLNELVHDEIVGLYLLDLYFPSIRDIVQVNKSEIYSRKSLITCRDYFESYDKNIYHFFKVVLGLLKAKRLEERHKEDLRTLIKMFKFYLEE